MFGKLTESFEKSAVREALKRGALLCPECGASAGALPARWEDAMACPKCGMKASLTEWAAASKPGTMVGRADSPPAGTKILREADGLGGTVWHVPSSGKFGFFLFFSLFWLGFTLLVSGGAVFSILTKGVSEGDEADWLLIPFFGVFYAVGFGMLYAAIRQKFMSCRLLVSGGEVRLRKEMLGRSKEKRLAAGTVGAVERKEFYQQNYKPVYGIEIRGSGGKLRFGTALTDDEKAWLVADIREAVFGKQEVNASSPAGGGSILEPMKLRAEPREEYFSVVIPGMTAGSLVGIGFFVMISSGFLAGGILMMKGEPWIGFRGVWTVLSSVFLLLGLTKFGEFFLNMGQDKRIEGNAAEISIRTYKRGLVVKDRSFPRAKVSDIRAPLSGSSGNRTMKRVDLITDDGVVQLAKWMDGDAADALVKKVRAVL